MNDLLILIIGMFGLFISVTMLADLWRMKPDRTIKVTYCKNVEAINPLQNGS